MTLRISRLALALVVVLEAFAFAGSARMLNRELPDLSDGPVPTHFNKRYVGSTECIGACALPYPAAWCGYGAVCYYWDELFYRDHGWETVTVTVSVVDDLMSPVAARICQENNDDVICGIDDTTAVFCGSITVTNWDFTPGRSLLVLPLGPASTAFYSPCGSLAGSGTLGVVRAG